MRRLAIRPGAIGDFILSLPALECLRCDYLEVWCAAPVVPLAQFGDRVRGIASTGLDLLSIAETPARLTDELGSFDSIVSWYGANRPEFRAETERLKLPCTFFPALPPADGAVHAADFYLAQVRTIAACGSDGIPRIRCDVEPQEFAAIQPFSGSAKKNWPLEKFRALAHEIEREMPVRWYAGPDDPPLEGARYLTDLGELARELAAARLYIGNDSGITHLAAAVGTPVLAFFGPSDPAVWGPRGAQVRIGRF